MNGPGPLTELLVTSRHFGGVRASGRCENVTMTYLIQPGDRAIFGVLPAQGSSM